MPSFNYRIVDVFTDRLLEGNALAVFSDARGLDDTTMQRIAREMNLSETTFVFPAGRDDCVARVRIFTPQSELPFAGHPTIGTAFVLMDEGRVPEGAEIFSLEEGVGPVPVRFDRGAAELIWLRTPSITDGPMLDPGRCAAALGLSQNDLLPVAPQILSAGNPTLFVAVRDAAAVDRASLDAGSVNALTDAAAESFCVFVFAPTQSGAWSRMFAPHLGVAEDPATGSSTGPLAAYMMQHGLVSAHDGARFISEQGVKMGRPSRLHVAISGDRGATGIDVGGHVVAVARGELSLPA